MSLRVLHVVRSVAPHAGTGAVFLPGLLAALRSRGVDCFVRSDDDDAGAADDAIRPFLAAGALRDAIRSVDVVHLHGFDRKGVAIALEIASDAGRPVVLSPLGDLSENPYEDVGRFAAFVRRRRDRALLRKATIVAGVNQSEADELRALGASRPPVILPIGHDFHQPGTRAHADANPPDLAGAPASDRILLFLGPIDPVEGLVPLLRAVAELGHDFRDWKLALAGPEPGPWRRKIEAALFRKRADDRVWFVTDPDAARQAALLKRSSILVSPSLKTRPPVTILQALEAGLPIVASPFGLIDELASIVRVCAATREALRDALRPLVTMPDEALRGIGSNARRAAAQTCDWSVLAPRYESAYHRAAAIRG